MSKTPGAPAVATCRWFDRPIEGGEWREYSRATCRASLGARILTVWLPEGAAIRCGLTRRANADPWADTYRHRFGPLWNRRLIEIKIAPGVFAETLARSQNSEG